MSSAAVIFDWDGVLADSAAMYMNLYVEVAARFGKSAPATTLAAFREWYDPRWERNFISLGITGDDLRAAIRMGLGKVRYDRVALFPEVPDLLRRLAADHALGIASTTPEPRILEKLETEGLAGLFRIVRGAGADGSDKTAIVGEALAVLGAGPRRTVVVGDTTADFEAAARWGLPAIGVTYGWMSRPRLEAAKPARLIDRPADLEPAVRSVLAGR